MIFIKKIILFSVIVFTLMGCESQEQFENYNFDQNSPLQLTATNHPHGFQKTSCFSCHLPQNIHQVDRLGDPSFAFAKTLVEQKGLLSCSGCHGTNGVLQ